VSAARRRPEPDAQAIFQAFDLKAKRFELIVNGTARPSLRTRINQQTRDAIYTSSFLAAHTAFESFLEDLFYSAVVGRSGIADCVPFTTFDNRENAERVFMGGKSFIDWLPFEQHSHKIAKRAFLQALPFGRLDRHLAEKKTLENMGILRNAIAHQSTFATRRASELTSSMNPRRRHVAGYLQDQVQGDTRYSLFTISMRAIAQALSARDTFTAKQFLSPEQGYNNGTSPGLGKFECTTCGRTTRVRSIKAPLPRCTNCSNAARRQKQ
jgi:hypothetical protein